MTFKSSGSQSRTAEVQLGSYILSIQAERFHRTVRYHWILCRAATPDRLVSWGHAPTWEMADSAARAEAQDLSAGRTDGGRVHSTVKPFTCR